MTPTPINNVEDLLAKMDMILLGIEQWSGDRNRELMSDIRTRAMERSNDLDGITITKDEFQVIGAKTTAIREAIRQADIALFTAQFDMN
jgi:hypothetical protein